MSPCRGLFLSRIRQEFYEIAIFENGAAMLKPSLNLSQLGVGNRRPRNC